MSQRCSGMLIGTEVEMPNAVKAVLKHSFPDSIIQEPTDMRL